MPEKAKHRRPRTSSFARGLVAVGTSGVVLAFPLVAAATADAAPSTRYVATAAAQKDIPATHTVVAGDTLAKIARMYSLPGGWKKLYQDNWEAIGSDPSALRTGLKLTLGKKAGSAAAPAPAKTYTDNLDGWIKESLDVMAVHKIPGTYAGIHRNIMRESSGNPRAINNWDSNAAAGTPSKGLLQVIDPTFKAYHVPGTSMDPYDPVANITAACNYAADRYGSIDNVNGPY